MRFNGHNFFNIRIPIFINITYDTFRTSIVIKTFLFASTIITFRFFWAKFAFWRFLSINILFFILFFFLFLFLFFVYFHVIFNCFIATRRRGLTFGRTILFIFDNRIIYGGLSIIYIFMI